MNPQTLREWLLVYKAQTDGAYAKSASRGDILRLGELLLKEIEDLKETK